MHKLLIYILMWLFNIFLCDWSFYLAMLNIFSFYYFTTFRGTCSIAHTCHNVTGFTYEFGVLRELLLTKDGLDCILGFDEKDIETGRMRIVSVYISFELISRKMNNYRKGQICNIVGAFTCSICYLNSWTKDWGNKITISSNSRVSFIVVILHCVPCITCMNTCLLCSVVYKFVATSIKVLSFI